MRALVCGLARVLAVALRACRGNNFVRDRASPTGLACTGRTFARERDGKSLAGSWTKAAVEVGLTNAKRARAKGLDPYSGLPGAAGNAFTDDRFGGAARLPEFRVRCRHQQNPRSGL